MATFRTQSATLTRFPVQRSGLDRPLARGVALLIGPQVTGGGLLAVGATGGGFRANGAKDPNRAGLRCAGTNHGVCVSCDDGARWQELNPGLRDIPVMDDLWEHDEPAMANHERRFRVLDSVGPLRWFEATTERELVLFDRAVAHRSKS